MTCVVSATLYFLISDFPEEVKFLNTEEKAFVKQRLYEDVGDSDYGRRITFKDVLGVFKDCRLCSSHRVAQLLTVSVDKIITGGFMYFGLIVPACESYEPPLANNSLIFTRQLRLLCSLHHPRPWTQSS